MFTSSFHSKTAALLDVSITKTFVFIQAVSFYSYCHGQEKMWIVSFFTLNRIFISLEMLPQYLETVIVRGMFRGLSNIMELFAKISNSF